MLWVVPFVCVGLPIAARKPQDPIGWIVLTLALALAVWQDADVTMRLRDAVDLDTMRRELLAAVDGAVEPTQASVWIRPHTPRLVRSIGAGQIAISDSVARTRFEGRGPS